MSEIIVIIAFLLFFAVIIFYDKKKIVQDKDENIMNTNDKEKQRELIKEIIQADEKDGLYDNWDVTRMDGLKNEPYILSSIDGDVFFEGINSETEPTETLKEAVKAVKSNKV